VSYQHVLGLALALSLPGAGAHAEEARPVRFILVGDSTMAKTSGYGNALCERVIVADTCLNLARAGRSSASTSCRSFSRCSGVNSRGT